MLASLALRFAQIAIKGSLQQSHDNSRDEAMRSFDQQHFGRHHAGKSVIQLDEEIHKVYRNRNVILKNEYQSSKLCEALYTNCEDMMDRLQVLRLPSMANFNAFFCAFFCHNCSSSSADEEIRSSNFWEMQKWNSQIERLKKFEGPEIVHLFCAKALKVAAIRAFLPEGKQLHAHLIKFGFCHVLSVQNQILSIYLKCNETKDALKLFDELPGRNVISWNIVIRGVVGCGNENVLNPYLGFSYFKRMLFEKVAPEDITLNALIGVCAKLHDIEIGVQLHCFAMKRGLDLDCFVGSALVDFYAKFGLVENSRMVFCAVTHRDLVMLNVVISCYALNCLPEEAFSIFNSMRSDGANGDEFTFSSLLNVTDAKRVFDKMAIRNVVAWNTVIVGCGNCGEVIDVMKILRDMLLEGFFPDELTISSVLSSCGYASAITETQQAHALAVKLSFQEFVSVSNSLITAYSKCGNITNAFKCFRLMLEPDLVTYTSLINAYAFHGLGKEAAEKFEKMISCGIKPDRISFLGILSAYHYTCVIDLLGRHGFINEAFEFLKSIPIQAESNMLGAFIGSCKLHENTELAKSAVGKLLAIEPEFERVRKIMRDKNVAKFPGCSWIQVGNQVHSFVSSDKVHPKLLQIYATLKMLLRSMKEENGVKL
ncbi:Pentatricopeptide repeat-containing protein [Arachis hypogaea]|nr:Pentatricopeptide repeat-containing protein [Arachis hypogaea]